MKGAHVDWAALKATLAEGERRLAAAGFADPARRDALLRKRARLLAARPDRARTGRSSTAAITFRLGNESFALATAALRRVLPLAKLVAVAGAPASILGVMDLRGPIGTVWSLSRLLDLPAGEATRPAAHVLVLRAGGGTQGLAVDEVDGTREIDLDSLLAAGGDGGGVLPLRFRRGLTPDGVQLLDATALLREIWPGSGS